MRRRAEAPDATRAERTAGPSDPIGSVGGVDGIAPQTAAGVIDNLESGRSSIARNVAHMLSSQVVTWVLATVVAIVQPRYLGPDSVGRLRLAVSLWAMASVVIGLGTSLYLQSEIARRGRDALALIGPILALRFIVFAVSSSLFGIYLMLSGSNPEFVSIMLLMGVGELIATCTDTYLSAFIGLERMSVPAAVGIVLKSLVAIGTVAVLLLGGDATSVVLVGVVAYLLSLIVLLWAFRKIDRRRLEIDRNQWSKIVRASFGFMLATLSLTVYLQVDAVVIAAFVDAQALGWYTTADVLFGSLGFFVTIVVTSMFPTFARLHEADPTGLQSLVKRTYSVLMLIAVPLGLGTLAIGTTIAPILYGEPFRETGPVLAVFGLVLILTTATILFGNVALATGRQFFWNMLLTIGIIMTIPLDMILVPWTDRTYDNGAIGGALAYLVTESVMVAIGLWKIVPYILDGATVWRTVRLVLAGGTMLAVVWPLRDQFLAIPIAVGAVVYSVAVILLGVVSREEMVMLRDVVARARAGGEE